MKARLTSDGSGVPLPMTGDEETEMRQQSEEWDERLNDLLTEEAQYLQERAQDVLTTGSAIIRLPEGTWNATLDKGDGWVITEGIRFDGQGSASGRTRIDPNGSAELLESVIVLELGIGMMWLREA